MNKSTAPISTEKAALIKKASEQLNETTQRSIAMLRNRAAEFKEAINAAVDAKLESTIYQIYTEAERASECLGGHESLDLLDTGYLRAIALESDRLLSALSEGYMAVLDGPRPVPFNPMNPVFGHQQPGINPMNPGFGSQCFGQYPHQTGRCSHPLCSNYPQQRMSM